MKGRFTMRSKLTTIGLLSLALAGCSVYDPAAAAGAAAASKAAASVTKGINLPNPAEATAAGRATAAAGAQASGGKGTGTPPAAPVRPNPPTAPMAPVDNEGRGDQAASGTQSAPQGIAVGEHAPTGRPATGAAILTPCTQDFIKQDANGDGWIDLTEWLAVGNGEATFKAKDQDGNAKLDRLEFGCEAPPTNPDGSPTGRG
jgi:hypothetical protein